MYIFIILLNIVILFSAYIVYKRKLQQKIQNECKKYIEKNKQILESAVQQSIQELAEQKAEVSAKVASEKFHLCQIEGQIDFSTRRLSEINSILSIQRESVKTYEDTLRKQAQEASVKYEADLRKLVEAKIENYEQEKFKAANEAIAETMAQLGSQSEAARAQLEQMEFTIKEYSAKQAAINEAIMRQRAIEEQQDFYRVCIGAEALSDISLLQETRKNLKKPEIIDKIIYDNYIAKPVLEMIKRVLQNESFSGIYKITNLETNEIYIGKSSDIRNRWQQHCKTVFNCGTIASSLLHTKMKQHGIEKFTFEVVERVEKDLLSEREKFYIDFYQSKEYGMNQRKG